MSLLLAFNLSDIASFSNIASVLFVVILAVGAYTGFKGSVDKSQKDQVNEIISNYKELSISLTSTIADLNSKLSSQETQIIAKNLQIDAQAKQLELAKNMWDAERAKMQADFAIERSAWIRQIQHFQELATGSK